MGDVEQPVWETNPSDSSIVIDWLLTLKPNIPDFVILLVPV